MSGNSLSFIHVFRKPTEVIQPSQLIYNATRYHAQKKEGRFFSFLKLGKKVFLLLVIFFLLLFSSRFPSLLGVSLFPFIIDEKAGMNFDVQ